jgi:LacI family transcriptional regulator/LacI family repressor for deo operon, udp, cdd, tsx, nupC, and nupG
LRNSPIISLEMRERIQQLAHDMKYVPNGIAQSLQMQRTNTIGLVVTSVADPFFGEVVRGVEEVAQTAGLSVLLTTSHNDPDREISAVDTFQRRRVDGIIVADSRLSADYKQQARHIEVPTVLINSQAEGSDPALHFVEIADRLGAQLAVEHLIQLGHQAIGYLGVGNRPRSNQLRLEGYRATLQAAGLACRDEWVVVSGAENLRHEDDTKAGQELLPRLLAAGVTAVFCHNDMLAVGALMACRDLGLRVPGDLSLVGFDDIALAKYVTPPLTTLHQPMLELGRSAMQTLLDLIDHKVVKNKVLKPFLVKRESSATPPLPHAN